MARNIIKKIKLKSVVTKRRILREKMFVTSFKLIILVILIIAVTYSWFVQNEKTKVAGISTNVAQMVELEVSLDNGKTWTKEATLDIGKDYTFSNEITSNGIDMYRASTKSIIGEPTSFRVAKKNEDYLDFKILFRSSINSKIYLEKKSKVSPNAGTKRDNLIESELVIRKSTEGNFSKDLIAGAVRVAFVENDNVSRKICREK